MLKSVAGECESMCIFHRMFKQCVLDHAHRDKTMTNSFSISIPDLLLLQDIIRAPLHAKVEITIRQAKPGTMRETLKEIDNKGITKVLAHLNSDDTYELLKAVSRQTTKTHGSHGMA